MPTERGERSEDGRAARKSGNPLQRGSACLSCRKRKMKCDASKPVCRQCIKANRANECEYDDGRQKSRTQILQEKIAKLEERIRELEPSGDVGDAYDSNYTDTMALGGSPEAYGSEFASSVEGVEMHGIGLDIGPNFPLEGAFSQPQSQPHSHHSHSPSASGSIPGSSTFSALPLELPPSLPPSIPSPLSSSVIVIPSSVNSLHHAHTQVPYSTIQGQTDIFSSPGAIFFGLPGSPGSGSSHSGEGPPSNTSNSGHGHTQTHNGAWSHLVQDAYAGMFATSSTDANPPYGLPLGAAGVDQMFDGAGPSGSRMPMHGHVTSAKRKGSEEFPLKDKKILLDIFLPHARQCGFDVHIERLHQRLGIAPKPQQCQPVHSALMNAIFLLACHFSGTSQKQPSPGGSPPPDLSAHEPNFLALTLRGIAAALEEGESAASNASSPGAKSEPNSTPLVDAVQASALLAVYFFAKARLLEGYYHASAAARLAVALGMHQIRCPIWRPPGSTDQSAPQGSSDIHMGNPVYAELQDASAGSWSGSPAPSVPLPEPKDTIELAERVSAFWTVFYVDRCWSVATGLPSSLPDDEHPQLRICTVWPWNISEEITRSNADYSSLSSLYNASQFDPSLPTNRCVKTFKSRAAALFERAARVASMQAEPTQWDQLTQTEIALAHFTASLPNFFIPNTSFVNPELVVVHTLAQVSVIQLHHPFAQKEVASHAKCLQAAKAVAQIATCIGASEYQFLDPIIGTCWMCASDVFIRENMWNKEQVNPPGARYGAPENLDTLVSALKKLSLTFPVALYQAQKVEQLRNNPF